MTTFGSVCSGIEAASVAFHPLGWRAAWFSEIEAFPSAVLAHQYPEVPNLGDMTKIAKAVLLGEVHAPDILCGGTPCQAFSVAGLRESLADDRGNLTLKFVELADAIDHVRGMRGKQPATVFWENVPGVLSTEDNAFGCFLAGLAGEDGALEPPEPRPAAGKSSRHWKWNKKLGKHTASWSNAGAVYGPQRAVAWRTLDAQYFGLAQRRRRVFVVASARKGFDPATVLFEWDGLRRDSAPSREAGEETARCLTRGTAQRYDWETEDFVTAHTLRGEGFDASEDGTGRGTPLVPVAYAPDLHPTMVARSSRGGGQTNSPGHNADETLVAVAFDTTQITSAANYSNPKPGDPRHPLAAGAHPPAIAFPANLSATQHASTAELSPALGAMNPTAVAHVEIMPTMTCGGGHEASHNQVSGQMRDQFMVPTTAMQVRRLTPRECERLQGFPDDYTLIPWRKRPSEECPDGPRYKALGNSWAVPNVAWIGRRIDAALRSLELAEAA